MHKLEIREDKLISIDETDLTEIIPDEEIALAEQEIDRLNERIKTLKEFKIKKKKDGPIR